MAPLLYPDQHQQLMVSIMGQDPSSIQVSWKFRQKHSLLGGGNKMASRSVLLEQRRQTSRSLCD